MTMPTEDMGHGITMEALTQLGKNRPGRAWLRDNVEIWKEQAKVYNNQAAKLLQMANYAQKIIEQKGATDKTDPEPGEDGTQD